MKSLASLLKLFGISALALLLLPSLAFAQYTVTNLVSNQGEVAPNTDQHLVNAWGLVALPGSPFWVSDNGSGFSTLYTGLGAQRPLFVSIPAVPGSPADARGPTGVVGNISPNAADFVVKEDLKSGKAIFLFATLDGLICGWSPQVAGANGPSHATVASDQSSMGASYTGLAIGSTGGQFLLYAADGGPNRKIDVFDGTFTLQHLRTPDGSPAFTDPAIPKTFTPYGIQNINGEIWVTYTALNNGQGGFVDRFSADGDLKMHSAAHGPLHSPWGLAQAPPDFGPMSNALLVSNNTPRGRINAFNFDTGEFLGPLRDASGTPIEIDQLWAIQFGHDSAANGPHNDLFFTAGSNEYQNGLFGVVTFNQH
jgi:uncharacterized protein (TIGR03118 family)